MVNAFDTKTINYLENRADGGFTWTVAYDLSFIGGIFLTSLRIRLVGDNAGATAAIWESGVESYWNNKVFFSDDTQLHEVRLAFDYVTSGQHHTVTVYNATGRADMNNWYLDPLGWGASYLDEIAAHEAGHMFGNFDEYAGGATHNGFTRTGTMMSDLSNAGYQDYFWSIEGYAEQYGGSALSTVLARNGGAIADSLTGTGGMDGFYGWGDNDSFNGLGGNDWMDGGLGTDTAFFSGVRAAYTLTDLGGGKLRVAGPDGTDLLTSVEWLTFSDMTVIWGNTAPIVTIADHTVRANGWAQVQSWLSYSDADGNPANYYEFWDGGSGATSGYVWTPANAHHAANTSIIVAASDLASVWVRGGQTAGSETMWVRAFDGVEWSTWDSFNFTTQANAAPVATIADHTVQTNEWAQIKNWISYSDADGDPATYYEFWDGGAEATSGHFWTPGNAHHAANTLITVAASDLANVWVRGGQTGGSETMWVRAFDGSDWGAWDQFTFATPANVAPVATIADHILQANAWAQVQSWLSYSDANGNPAIQYAFFDGGAEATSGYFWTPGNAHHAANTAIVVSASDLASTWVRGGQVGGSETMWVAASDGAQWSAWDQFTLFTV